MIKLQPKAGLLSGAFKAFDRNLSTRLGLSGGFASLLDVTGFRGQASLEAEGLGVNWYVKRYTSEAVALASLYGVLRGSERLRDLQAATENRVLRGA